MCRDFDNFVKKTLAFVEKKKKVGVNDRPTLFEGEYLATFYGGCLKKGRYIKGFYDKKKTGTRVFEIVFRDGPNTPIGDRIIPGDFYTLNCLLLLYFCKEIKKLVTCSYTNLLKIFASVTLDKYLLNLCEKAHTSYCEDLEKWVINQQFKKIKKHFLRKTFNKKKVLLFDRAFAEYSQTLNLTAQEKIVLSFIFN